MSAKIISRQLTREEAEKIIDYLSTFPCKIREDVPHTIFHATAPKLTLILYQSLKLVIQGENASSFEEKFFHVSHEFQETFTRIGADESGKGDYFGPLVCSAVYVDNRTEQILQELGVKDCKKLSNLQCFNLCKLILEVCPVEITKVNPRRYNEMYSNMKNLNTLLAWAHANTIKNLLKQITPEKIILDKFAKNSLVESFLGPLPPQTELIQIIKAESDTAVAAASIVARATFLSGLSDLSKKCGFKLPPGYQGTISTGKQIVASKGQNYLFEVAKVHFKNTQSIL